jgi:hypothetical protein
MANSRKDGTLKLSVWKKLEEKCLACNGEPGEKMCLVCAKMVAVKK